VLGEASNEEDSLVLLAKLLLLLLLAELPNKDTDTETWDDCGCQFT
jgi:hypothetical protein